MNKKLNDELYNLLDSNTITENTFYKIKDLNDIEICKFLIYNRICDIIFNIGHMIILESSLLIVSTILAIIILDLFTPINIVPMIPSFIVFFIIFSLFIAKISYDITKEPLDISSEIINRLDFLHKIIKEEEK